MVFASTKENGKDTLVYSTKLIDSNTGAIANCSPFLLPSRLIASKKVNQRTTPWSPESISLDDKQVALVLYNGYADCPLYIVDISGESPKEPELITLPGTTEKLGEISYRSPRFSRDPALAHVLYVITNAFGDFASVVSYDTRTRTVTHITTPEPSLGALRPISWETRALLVTTAALFFRANVEGWQTMYAVPFSGVHANKVLEVHCAQGWEGFPVGYSTNVRNGRPNELVVHFNSFRMNGFLASVDFSHAFETESAVERDDQGHLFVSVAPRAYRQAAPSPPQFKVYPPKLLKFRSFDNLEVPCMYYHPNDGKTAVPVIVNIHGGPESQSTADSRMSVPSFNATQADSRLTLTAPDLVQFMDTCLTSLVALSSILMSVEAPDTGDATPRWMTCSNEKTRSSLAFNLLFSEWLLIIVPQRYRVSPGPHRPEHEERAHIVSDSRHGRILYASLALSRTSYSITLSSQMVATWST